MTDRKIALVTGAAHRIGAEVSRALHNTGYNIVIHYRSSSSAAQAIADEFNQQRENSCRLVQANLNSIDEVNKLATDVISCFGGVDLLVNNASSFYPTAVESASEDDWNDLINSNLKGPFFLTQALIGTLKERCGNVINIVDIHSERPMRDHSIYCIAKAGLAMMTKTLAKELAPNIRVNGISPGAILWPEQEMNEQTKQSILNKVPMQATGECGDIAKAAVFLADNAPYITGQIIAVDGGRSLNL